MRAEQVKKVISRLSEDSASAGAYKEVEASTLFVIDDSVEVLLGADGTVQHVPDGAPDLTVRLSSKDATEIIGGELSVMRSVTSGRVAADGPIFQVIAVLRSISRLTSKGE